MSEGMKIIAARKYAGDVVKWIWGAKYSGKPRNGFDDATEAIKDFAASKLQPEDYGFVTSVPGRIGGKTHALAPRLAETVAHVLGRPYFGDVLERTREAPAMRRMGREERKEHVRGLYRARRKVAKGIRILLVDDVSTTGATLRECARVLLAAGAREVVGLVLAKVEKKRKGKVKVAKKKKKQKAKPAAGEAATRQIIRVRLAAGEESSRRSSKALAAAKAKARRMRLHFSIESAFAWWPKAYTKSEEKGEHEPVEIVADVYATSEDEAKRIVAWASFVGGGGRRRKGRR